MKSYALLFACGLLAGCAGNGFAAMVGSTRPVVRENFQKLIKNNACPSCDLAGVVLNRVDLSGANLEGANLAGAKMFLTDLSDANLRNANLQGAALGGADLAGADLRGANLTGAVLEGAFLTGVQLDGTVVADKPYEAEGLTEVSEQKYISDESQGKDISYTQDVVISDRRDLSETTPAAVPDKVQVEEKVISEKTDAEEGIAKTHAKTLVPMADAVVPNSATKESAGKVEEESGVWGSIVSFFGSDSDDAQEQVENDTPGKETGNGVVLPPATETPAVHTGKDELAPDATVLTMIEQIEGPAPEPEKVEVVEQESVSTADVGVEPEGGIPSESKLVPESPSAKTGQSSTVEEKTVVAKTEAVSVVEQPDSAEKGTAEPAADSSVGAMIDQIESDQVEEPISPVGSVYTVETPEQAQVKRRLIIDRLLDVGRCVACNLAGADLAGEKLDEADLERANLAGADLEGVDLSEANLKGVDFSGANLKRADLRDSDLYLADFSGADLTGARFEGALIDMADFSNARGAKLEGAINE